MTDNSSKEYRRDLRLGYVDYLVIFSIALDLFFAARDSIVTCVTVKTSNRSSEEEKTAAKLLSS